MASNREERLQMRQRGAGTRKIKEVDFGFSLGLGSAPDPPQPASQPADEASAPGPTTQPPSIFGPPAPETTSAAPPETQSSQQSSDTPSSQAQSVRRTPGSARNKLPPRPSTFDIPADEELDLGRSSKRRKIEPPQPSRPSIHPRSKSNSPRSSPNGTAATSTIPRPEEPIDIPIRTNTVQEKTQGSTERLSAEAPPIAPIEPSGHALETAVTVDQQLETGIAEQTAPEASDQRPNGTSSPSDASKGRRKRREPRSGQSSPAHSVTSPRATGDDNRQPEEHRELPQPEQQNDAEANGPKSRRGKRLRSRTPTLGKSTSPPVEASVAEQQNDSVETEGPSARREKRLRSRTPASGKSPSPPAVEAPVIEQQDDSVEAEAPKPRRGNRVRNRTPASEPTAPAEETAVADVVGAEATSTEGKGKGRRGRKPKNREPTPKASVSSKEPDTEPVQAEPEPVDAAGEDLEASQPEQGGQVDKGKKRAGRPSRKATQSPEAPEKVPQSRGRPRKERKPDQPQEPEPEPTPTPEPELEPEPMPEPVSETQPAKQAEPKGTKRRRGRRPAGERPTPEEAVEEPSEPVRKKPRQPRGETVPVTVHRLANATSLGAPAQDHPSSEEDSADELSNREKTKLPSRGGVNAADVLGQICRETLEKTLTTLKNGISNEANAARRAEWTLRRKAVEAFGTELEGRLFELSEMLDSNFMLGVQVRKAKRGMMDLRGRLDQVRRERQAVALKMDAVRREHAKEEHSRSTRSTINHSLHNLDLALERGQNRAQTSDSPLTAGLEFKLRSVAETVSSVASGAQGGLLHQIKAFNAQLEATARRLES